MDETKEIVVEVAGVDSKDYHLVAALDRAAKATFGPLASKYTSRLQKHHNFRKHSNWREK